VKLTVAHDAIPRRATTLADDAFVAVGPEPARGGPADRRLIGGAMPAGGSERRTTVRFSEAAGAAGPGPAGTTAGAASMAGAIPIARPSDPPVPGEIMEPVFPLTGPETARTEPGRMVGIPISSGQEASTGWTRNSWGCSITKRGVPFPVGRTRARKEDRPTRRRPESTIRPPERARPEGRDEAAATLAEVDGSQTRSYAGPAMVSRTQRSSSLGMRTA